VVFEKQLLIVVETGSCNSATKSLVGSEPLNYMSHALALTGLNQDLGRSRLHYAFELICQVMFRRVGTNQPNGQAGKIRALLVNGLLRFLSNRDQSFQTIPDVSI